MPRGTSSRAFDLRIIEMAKTNLLPTELHHYSLGDCLRGAVASRKPVRRSAPIDLPGLGEAVPVRSARAAVVIALRALGLPPGSRIGVPLHCCPVVFKAIRAAGCTPRFLDIEPETFCLSAEDLRAKASGIDALIAVHMFGNLCDMPQVLEIMRGKPVIEDCAQSIGSRLDGRMCGSFGDLSFFSFRSGKYLSVGEGGALYSPRPDLRARLAELVNALPVPSRGRGGRACRHDLPPIEAAQPALVGLGRGPDLGDLQSQDGIRGQIPARHRADLRFGPGHAPQAAPSPRSPDRRPAGPCRLFREASGVRPGPPLHRAAPGPSTTGSCTR